jgi:hypothetical protein
MAKRFIDPDWKKLRVLPGYMQRAWFYIWDKADECGVYHYDVEYFKLDLRLTEAVTIDDLGKLPDCEILPGDRILLKNFLQVNYTKLKPGYNPHKPAFRALERNQLRLNSSLNQASLSLEEEGEDEEEDKEEGLSKGTKEFQPAGVVAEMAEVFQAENSKYPRDKDKDFPALLEIAEAISEEQRLIGSDMGDQGKKPVILRRWGELVKFMKTDPFLCKYSLTQINKHFQSVVQSFNNANNFTKSGKSTSHQPVITGAAEGAGTF